jgi:hypothetical protein
MQTTTLPAASLDPVTMMSDEGALTEGAVTPVLRVSVAQADAKNAAAIASSVIRGATCFVMVLLPDRKGGRHCRFPFRRPGCLGMRSLALRTGLTAGVPLSEETAGYFAFQTPVFPTVFTARVSILPCA